MIKLKQNFILHKPSRIEWLSCGAIFVFLFFCFQYIDFESLTVWTTNFWDVIFKGNLLDYYAYTAENHYQLAHPYSHRDIISQLPWIIWNFPIAFIQYFLNIDALYNPFMMAWSKLFLVSVLLVTLRVAYCISMLVINDHVKSLWVVFLSLSSVFVYSAIFYSGQDDIIVVCLSVTGVYYYLKNNLRLYVLFFALSIAIKPFSLFIFVPLLLLYEKRIYRIFIAAVSAFSLMIISNTLTYLLFMGTESQANVNESIAVVYYQIIAPTFHSSFGATSFFAVLFATVCIACYCFKPKNQEYFFEYTIYIVTSTYLLLFMFTVFEPYRIILLVPFIYILIMNKAKIIKLNIILEICLQTFYFSCAFIMWSWCYAPELLRNSLYLKLFGLPDPPALIRKQLDFLEPALPLLAGLFFACAAALIVLNFPKVKLKFNEAKCERGLIWIRLAVFLPFVLITFIYYYITYIRV